MTGLSIFVASWIALLVFSNLHKYTKTEYLEVTSFIEFNKALKTKYYHESQDTFIEFETNGPPWKLNDGKLLCIQVTTKYNYFDHVTSLEKKLSYQPYYKNQ